MMKVMKLPYMMKVVIVPFTDERYVKMNFLFFMGGVAYLVVYAVIGSQLL